MPKASPLLRAFNGGVVSELLHGRTDIDKYGVLLRQSSNYVPTPQGPLVRRSGTELQRPVYDETKMSYMLEFIFSNNAGQSYNVEAADLRFRWHNEDGLLAYAPLSITATANVAGFLRITVPGHSTVLGDETALAGFTFVSGYNGVVGKITAVAGNLLTTDIPYVAPGSIATATAARVYHVASPYLAADVNKLRFTSDRDVLYLWCEGYVPHTLSRYGAYDWRLAETDYIDGPYAPINETTTTLKPLGTGHAVPRMTSDVLPAGNIASASGGANPYLVFDRNRGTYWDSGAAQTGYVQIQLAAPAAVDGYVIEVARANNDATYKSVDYAPGTWTFEGSDDGVTWIVLDSKVAYVLYTNLRSLCFKLKNDHAYLYYRLDVTQCTRNGPINVRVANLDLTARSAAVFGVLASSVNGINQDAGFATTDVGRLIRFQCTDGLWRWMKIVERMSALSIRVELKADVLASLDLTTEWRLGLFSATTGYPISGTFFEDRLCVGGMFGYPDWLVCSVTGKYTTIAQTDTDGTVNDDNGIVVRINARKLGRIVWINSDNRSLLLGTESGEWQVSSADLQSALTARTAKARRINARGSASVEPAFVDRQGLYVQRGARTLRELSYSFDIDGYKSPSLSLLASHLGVNNFEQIVFAQEPMSIAWLRTGDGKLLGFTYNSEENVRGWHEHDVGGFVESLTVLPAANGRQDTLWMIVRRVINGVTRRFIERMAPTWDFFSTLDTAHYVDCGIRYQGTPINRVYGLRHAIGTTVHGLADGSPFTPQVVDAVGSITLPQGKLASNIVIGYGFASYAETMRMEAGAGDGTAQGKTKRTTKAVFRLWASAGGQFGTREANETLDLEGLEPINWLEAGVLFDDNGGLFTGDTRPLSFPDGYQQSGTIAFRQAPEIPLPFNVVAIMPQLNTQDR